MKPQHLQRKLLVSLILTRKCILDCPYCALIKDEVGELPVQWWIDAISKLAPYTEDFIFCGAEPTLFENVDTLLRYMNGRNLSYSFCTTGMPTLLKKVEGLVRSYSVSVDTLRFENPEIPISIRKKSQWGFNIVRQFSQESNMSNFVEIVITAWNQDDIIPMLDLFSKSNFTICLDVAQDCRGQVRSSSFSTTDVQTVWKYKLEAILRYVIDNYKRLKMVDGVQYYKALLDGETFFCKGKGARSITIDADGMVAVCNDKLHSKVGTLDDFLKGDSKLLGRYDIVQKACSGCMYNCYYSFYNDLLWTKSSI